MKAVNRESDGGARTTRDEMTRCKGDIAHHKTSHRLTCQHTFTSDAFLLSLEKKILLCSKMS